MKINILFRLISILLIAALVAISVIAFRSEQYMIFWAVEALAIAAIAYMLYFHRRVIKPLQVIGDGMDLLREQDFNSRLRIVGQSEADRIVAIFNRMMEQLKEERLQVRETNNFLDLLIDASPLGVIILDLEERIFSVNHAACSFMAIKNVESFKGKKLSELSEIDNTLITCLLHIEPYQSQIVRLNNATVYKFTHSRFVDRGHSHSFYLLELLTEEVFKAEKKAYEKVIRMLAHEVNNTTAGVIATLDAIKLDAEAGNSDFAGMDADATDVLQTVIERCYGLNRFIANYADVVRIPEPQRTSCSLNELVSSCVRFLRHTFGDKQISVVQELNPDNPVVLIDSALFEQALVNILKNAVESIEHQGNIHIRTTSSPVALEIADNGKGIDSDTESKLFTPFFSTKPNGQGLGLIFIREVLQKHDCIFSLKTGTDGITRFMIGF
ncbi:MAG: HAMP domain-containing protein [Tannerella sp.]|jgi:nitrogen fixation/metabolism regulation signal transduction histidine kinase|nr:HAMP domain-containing protein [Tannerella sp.]